MQIYAGVSKASTKTKINHVEDGRFLASAHKKILRLDIFVNVSFRVQELYSFKLC